MYWNEIFEDWPKAEINEWGVRTFEFLPNFNQSLHNITYITWEDNSYCDNFHQKQMLSFVKVSVVNNCELQDISYHVQDVEKFRKKVSPDALY